MAKKKEFLKVMKSLPPKKIIKLGTKGGSGWFYLGTVKDCIGQLDYISEELYKSLKLGIKAASQNLETKLRNWPTPEKYARYELRNNDFEKTITFEQYQMYLKNFFVMIVKAKKGLIKAEKNLGKFAPLAKREVIEISEADDAIEEACLRIIVEGTESGKYWSTDEADSLPALGIIEPTDVELDEEDIENEQV